MLAGLTQMELGRLRMSVGYGGQKKGRPLSPVEVGLYFRRAREAGATLSDCTVAAKLDKTGVTRFLRIADFPTNLQHMIDWGAPKNAIGFSTVLELTRFEDVGDQKVVGEAILLNKLTSREVRQIVQLHKRSGRLVEECIKEVLGMRPIIERRYVFIGTIVNRDVKEYLSELTQAERSPIMENAVKQVNLRGVTGRLGKSFFTMVGGDQFNKSMTDVGKENIETQLRNYLMRTVLSAKPPS